jgi:hypothetical protein
MNAGTSRVINVTIPKIEKKSPRSGDLGLNPPKEEGGGDNRGMSPLPKPTHLLSA